LDAQGGGVRCPLEPRDVLVGFAAEVDLAHGTAVEVVNEHRHQGVVLAGFGVLELIGLRVQVSPVRQLPFLHPAFVEAEESDVFPVWRPLKALDDGKLLLVYPIGGSVDDAVDLPVLCHLPLLSRFKISDEKVVPAYEPDLAAVGRKGCQLLFPSLRQPFELFCLRVKDIILRF